MEVEWPLIPMPAMVLLQTSNIKVYKTRIVRPGDLKLPGFLLQRLFSKNNFHLCPMIIAAGRQHYRPISDLWERSVRATHLFLAEDYLQIIKKLLPAVLPAVQLYVFEEGDKTISGFLGDGRTQN